MNGVFIKEMYSMIISHMDIELAGDLLCLPSLSFIPFCQPLLHTSSFPVPMSGFFGDLLPPSLTRAVFMTTGMEILTGTCLTHQYMHS